MIRYAIGLAFIFTSVGVSWGESPEPRSFKGKYARLKAKSEYQEAEIAALKQGLNNLALRFDSFIKSQPSLSLLESSASIAAGSDYTVVAMRLGPVTSETTVTYRTVNGTAIAGTDYTHVNGTGLFQAGVLEEPLAIIQTSPGSDGKSFYVELTGFSADASAGAITTTTISLTAP